MHIYHTYTHTHVLPTHTAKDAFNNTPLNDAVRAKHDLAASTLRRLGPKEGDPPIVLTFSGNQAGVKLCEAAAAGDLEQVHMSCVHVCGCTCACVYMVCLCGVCVCVYVYSMFVVHVHVSVCMCAGVFMCVYSMFEVQVHVSVVCVCGRICVFV
jgi:hypothetical protein